MGEREMGGGGRVGRKQKKQKKNTNDRDMTKPCGEHVPINNYLCVIPPQLIEKDIYYMS